MSILPAPAHRRPLPRRLIPIGVLAASAALAAPAPAQEHQHPAGDAATLGTVAFASSCAPAVADDLNRAVAMLHSFWFDAALDAFARVAEADPTCAMARWGTAMTLMGNPMARALPSAEALRTGLAAAQEAGRLAATQSHREQMYAGAVLAYYAEPADRDLASRTRAHEESMAALAAAHPEDPEATIFHARAMVANAPPTDLTFARQIAAAELLQPLFEANPDHPGLAHYIIHAFDAPALAARGREAARVYAGIAPAAPHALHMPSHIFTRLGDWEESIETNARSARAEPDSNAAVHPMDYLVYAHLQLGQDAAARRVVERAVQNPDRFYGGLLGYNFTAMPARFALERNAWADAAALRVPVGALPYVEAVTRFARAVGAARAGQPDVAETDVAVLGRLETTLRDGGDTYWATVVGAQRLATEAWVARARGDDASALRLAAEAAALEESVEKHPVTPGPILPARELEGDLLMEVGRPADALAAYERTLTREPNRSRALFGAARAAEAAGDAARARAHYGALRELMTAADPERPEPREAQRYLAGA